MPQGSNIAADIEAVKRAADSQHHNRRGTAADINGPFDMTPPSPCPSLPSGQVLPHTHSDGHPCNEGRTTADTVSPLVDAEVPTEGIHPAWTDPDHPDTVGYTMPRVDPVTDTTASVGPFSMTEDEHGATLQGFIQRGGIRFEVPPRPTGDYAREVAEQAVALFTGDRNADYGDATDNFEDIGNLWAVVFGHPVSAEQVAICSALIKVARLNNTPTHDDSWVDATAYLALGAGINRRRADTTTTEEN
jgi:hypothetical protein